MPRLEPALLPVVIDLERGLRLLQVPFAVVGALVPELLLDERPARMTNDADVTVIVESLDVFERLKDDLASFGFARTPAPHRLQHSSGGRVDILPYGKTLAPDGRLELQRGFVLNMAGFEHAVPSAVSIAIDDGPTLPITPLPLYVLLKLVAFSDRKAPRDLAGVFHCLRHYLHDDERRYGLDHQGAGVPFEYTGAYLLGLDGRSFVDGDVTRTVAEVLRSIAEAEVDVAGMIAREQGSAAMDDDARADVFEHFAWYSRGLDPGGAGRD